MEEGGEVHLNRLSQPGSRNPFISVVIYLQDEYFTLKTFLTVSMGK